MKLKKVLPSLREKKRYIVFELIANNNLGYNVVKNSIKQAISGLIGEFGIANADLRFLNEWKNNKGVMAVNRGYVDEARAGISLVKSINNVDVIMRTVGISGILKKAEENFFK